MSVSESREPWVGRAHDQKQLRYALGHYCSGITVVCARGEHGLVGVTCQSFFSASLNPPLVGLSIGRNSTSFPKIRAAGSFCVNVLSIRQRDLSQAFARSGADKWAGVEWTSSPNLAHPILGSVVAWFECVLDAEYPAGDHTLVLGRLVDLHCDEVAHPLLYFQGRYSYLADPRSATEG